MLTFGTLQSINQNAKSIYFYFYRPLFLFQAILYILDIFSIVTVFFKLLVKWPNFSF